MDGNTQLLILAAVALALLGLAALRQREAFVSGNVVGIQADLKRQGIERALHTSAAGVADSTQKLGCAYLASLAASVSSTLPAGAKRLPCSQVADQLKKLDNTLAGRVGSSALSRPTKAKMNAYRGQAMDAFRSVFDPLCKGGTFDAAELRAALAAIQVSYCGATPAPRNQAGAINPALTSAVQQAQKALATQKKAGGKTAGAALKTQQLQAALDAANAALLAANIKAVKPALAAQADPQARAAAAAARAAQSSRAAADAKREAGKGAAAVRTLRGLYQKARSSSKPTVQAK